MIFASRKSRESSLLVGSFGDFTQVVVHLLRLDLKLGSNQTLLKLEKYRRNDFIVYSAT